MSELRVIRGRDLELKVDGDVLCGATYFKAVSQSRTREIREFLSGQPVDVLSAGGSHEIELTVLELFAGGVPEDSEFTLSVADGGSEYIYEGCRVVRRERIAPAKANLSDKYLIRAVKMTKRGIQNA